MFDSSTYLTLRSSEISPGNEWGPPAEGLLFLHLKQGQSAFGQGFASHSLTAGDILVANNSNNLRLRATNGEAAVFRWFLTRVEQLYALFDNSEIFLLQKIADGYRSAKCYPKGSLPNAECLQLLVEGQDETGLNQRGRLLRVITAILASEMQNSRHAPGSSTPSIPDHFVRILQQLSAEELITYSVGELARKFGCGRRHLNRLFHRHVGVSVAALRMEMRLLKAVALLRDPEAKIIHIASQCGFNHLGLFNTCFKRRFGLSPGLWRKSGTETAKTEPVAGTGAMAMTETTQSEPADASGFPAVPSEAPTPKLVRLPPGTKELPNQATNLIQLKAAELIKGSGIVHNQRKSAR